MPERVSADIEALVDFRLHLLQFNSDLGESFANMRAHWRSLAEVWSDDMYHRLGDALAEVLPGLEQYLSATEHHEAYLSQLIERLRDVRSVSGGW